MNEDDMLALWHCTTHHSIEIVAVGEDVELFRERKICKLLR